MPNITENYGLKKPLPEEFYDINVQNENMDIIDDEMKKRIPCLATYYPLASGKSADDLIDPFALIPVSTDVNAELYNIVGGTFAYIWTNFYIKADVTSRRMQIAASYNTVNHKMAFRIYGANGWLAWKGLANDDDATNIPVTSKVPSDADIWIDPNEDPYALTPADIGAAPAGYGLGASCVALATWEDATKNGFYTSTGGLPSGFVGDTFQGIAVDCNKFVILNIWQTGNGLDNVHLFRKYSNVSKTWGEWEFVNPPMLEGVEYRTTERYNGHPVYTMAFSFRCEGDYENPITTEVEKVFEGTSIELVRENLIFDCYGATMTHDDYSISVEPGETYYLRVFVRNVNDRGNARVRIWYHKWE